MNALNKGIGFLIAGILLPYIGVRVTGGFLLGNGEVPSFVAKTSRYRHPLSEKKV
jgi:hypothetical protein